MHHLGLVEPQFIAQRFGALHSAEAAPRMMMRSVLICGEASNLPAPAS
jgi:hypothetical protein